MKTLAKAALLVVLASPAGAQINAGEQKPEASLPFNMATVTTFNLPWRLAFLPDGRMLVTEKVGPLWLVTPQGMKRPVLNYPAVLYGGQGGMLGVYVSPNFAADQTIYLTYSEPGTMGGISGSSLALAKGKLVIDMSSISPIATKDFARKVNALGCDYLDAPVSGGEVGAKQASLTIMVGGPDAAFARARPLFEAMGRNITHVGAENGAGQTCKVANQIIVALNLQAVAEALVFAAKAGADPAKVRTALMGGFAASRILEVHGERMINGTFNPGFRIRLHQKDLNLALTAAKELALPLPNTAMAQQMFASVAAHGGADLDHSAMVKAVEGMAGFSLQKNA